MPPAILKLAKKDVAMLWIVSAFAIGLSLPEVCKPTIPNVKIKPTLHVGSHMRFLVEEMIHLKQIKIKCQNIGYLLMWKGGKKLLVLALLFSLTEQLPRLHLDTCKYAILVPYCHRQEEYQLFMTGGFLRNYEHEDSMESILESLTTEFKNTLESSISWIPR